MFLLTCYILLICLGFMFQKNKTLSIVFCGFMWLLMGWSYGNADYNIYLDRYNNSSSYKTLEPFYTILQDIAKGAGLEYESFLIICSGICLLIRFYVIWQSTAFPNFVLSLYLLFPFVMDIVQIRFFYASTIVFWGWYVFINTLPL